MINTIKEMLRGDNYKVVNIFKEIRIYHIENNSINPECFIVSVYEGDGYHIYVVRRSEKKFIARTNYEDNAIAIIVVLCKKYFEHPNNDIDIIEQVRKLVDSSKIDKAIEILNKNLDSKYFSLSKVKRNKISMVSRGKKVDIVYQETDIVTNVGLAQGYVALYNYAKLLMYFDGFFADLRKRLEIRKTYSEMAKIFIL